ncbi:luciferin 4-monooxygenase-like [Tropilaelaps mercedesae]|uniref:Luciferin 4-monooxygenase-like n=1 Tax=Tropilaelaps mercedesae TaxID=418985 RepID=A0A1V9X8Z7_9ACAR|nr:luciferin 4-monooxygenase-like [Tropilaelaps mercedesae]
MTDDFTEDGFYRTGDIGVIDVDGQLNLLGRNKQFIICLDSRVSPMEIENVLLEHPAVAEAVVVGVPHPHYQEAPTALVVTKGRISKEHLNSELVEFVAARLVEYKQLHGGVFFTDELEKTRSGKYSRGAIEKTIRRLIEESKSS